MKYSLLIEKGVPKEVLEAKNYKDKEEEIQSLLEKNPVLIPVQEINESAPPILIIGVEVDNIDLLGVDENGLLTIIETKLLENSEQRREVIGQVLEYGSGVAEWSVSDVEKQAENYFKGVLLQQKIEELHNKQISIIPKGSEELTPKDEWSYDSFLKNLNDNLERGNLRLLIIGDEINDTLKRTVKYVNAHLQNCSMYCVEVKNFEDKKGEIRFLVPNLVGFGEAEKQTQRRTESKNWDEDSFRQNFDQSPMKPEEKKVFDEIYRFIKDEGNPAKFGKGKSYPSFGFYSTDNEKHQTQLFYLSVDGDWKTLLYFQFKNLLKFELVESLVKQYAQKLKECGVIFQSGKGELTLDEAIKTYPYFYPKNFKLEPFKQIIRWMKKQIEG